MALQTDLDGKACLALAVLCLTLPLNWLAAAVVSAVIHECCHILPVWLFGGTIHRMTIGPGGAVLETAPMTPWQAFFSILAGPLGSFSLLLVRTWAPKAAICGLLQGLFNLLPILPLDGGRALVCLSRLFFSEETGDKICMTAAILCQAALLAGGFWFSIVKNLGWGPLILALFLLTRTGFGKKSCNEGILRVQ